MSLFGNFSELYKKKDHIKYVDDYATELEQDEKGKYRKITSYIGPKIPVRTELKSLRPRLFAVVLMAFLLTSALIYALFMKHASGISILLSTLLTATLFPCLYLIMGTLHLPYSGKPMQRDGYMHGMIRMLRSAGAIMILLIAVFVDDFLYRLRVRDWMYFKEDILFLVLIVVADLLAVGIVLILRSIEVDELELNQYNEMQNL